MQIGFIGLGRIGMAMLERLCLAELAVCCYARRAEVNDAASALGADVLDSARAVAERAELLLVCLYNDEQLRELLLGPDGLCHHLRRGAIVVLHTTGSPKTTEAIAKAAAARQAVVLDAPISGGPHDIRVGKVTLLVGGEARALERCRLVLSCYADPILHIGPLGSGQQTKLINNLLFGAQLALVAEASRLMERFGLHPQQAFRAISHCSGNSEVLRLALNSGSVERLVASAGDFIAKDRRTAEAVAEELEVDLGVLELARQV
ncbi:NAD(P)-dependent oxidoreductase [Halioxenophilus sp. WMMB6]|uniref:NAD(P)-dependent oxidoreductase n=1 Tax=Halioxenophilus sp. WMMB6 TaxID=3073815 RepID=UPI00295E7A1D|nr:NAD(P)-dependent oxidoreductase [Halioxenophilus sp. WMMB6]